MLKKIFIAYVIFYSASAYSYSIAIKLDLPPNTKNDIYQVVNKVGYPSKEIKNLIPKANYHVTIGYININNFAQAKQIANDIKLFLTKTITKKTYFLSIDKAINFGSYTILDFDTMTKASLKNLNIQLDAYVKQLSMQKKLKFSLNKLTQPRQYMPHWTIKKQPTIPVLLKRLNEGIDSLKTRNTKRKLLARISKVSYSIVSTNGAA